MRALLTIQKHSTGHEAKSLNEEDQIFSPACLDAAAVNRNSQKHPRPDVEKHANAFLLFVRVVSMYVHVQAADQACTRPPEAGPA